MDQITIALVKMDERDSVTKVGCPYGDIQYGGTQPGKHLPTYLCIVDGKLQCVNQVDGRPCPVKTFLCNRDSLKCTVCDEIIQNGSIIFIHTDFVPSASGTSKKKSIPINGKYVCSSKCFWGKPMSLRAKYRSLCPKCGLVIPIGSAIREVNTFKYVLKIGTLL